MSALPEPAAGEHPAIRGRAAVWAALQRITRAVQENDEQTVQETVLRLSQSRRGLGFLALLVDGFATMFHGLRLLFSNWRLALVQVLPATWIWLASVDLKAHVMHGKSFHALRGPVLIPPFLAIMAITAAVFFLNAVFAYSISQPGTPEIRPAVEEAKRHKRAILVPGLVVGALLAFSTLVVTRWGHPWFGLSLGIVIGVMMIAYVAIPSRLIGADPPKQTRSEKLKTGVVGAALSGAICTPPYMLLRLGILMLGSKILFIPGVILIAVGGTAHAGASGAVKAVKMSTKLRPTDP